MAVMLPSRLSLSLSVGVAEALAAADPGRAERIAQSITDEYLKASALTKLASAAVLPG